MSQNFGFTDIPLPTFSDRISDNSLTELRIRDTGTFCFNIFIVIVVNFSFRIQLQH